MGRQVVTVHGGSRRGKIAVGQAMVSTAGQQGLRGGLPGAGVGAAMARGDRGRKESSAACCLCAGHTAPG